MTPAWTITTSQRTLLITNSQAFVTQDFFWDDRIVPTLGWRRDVADSRALATNATPIYYNGVNGWLTNISTVSPYTGDSFNPTSFYEQIGNTSTEGVTVYPLPWLGVFFNQSRITTAWRANVFDMFGNLLPPSHAVGRDWGVKFPLFHGKIYLTVDRYTANEQDVSNTSFKNGFGGSFVGSSVLSTLVTNLYMQTNNQMFVTQNPWVIPYANTSWAAYASDWETGIEFQLTANPVPNWRVSAGFAKQNSVPSNYGTLETNWYYFAYNYVQTNLPGAFAVSTGNGPEGVPETLAQIFGDYRTALSQLESLSGLPDSRQPEYTGTFLTAYDFTTGPLRGFGVGGDLRYRGRVAIGFAFRPGTTTLFNTNAPFMTSGRSQVGLFAYRNFRLPGGVRCRVQLNADNINLSKNLYPWFQTDNGSGQPITAIYAVGQGTTWALSSTFDY